MERRTKTSKATVAVIEKPLSVPPSTIFCRYCNGPRNVVVVADKRLCNGCGSHAANAHVPNTSREKNRVCPKCPHCRSTNAAVLEPGRYECQTCHGVYEALEQGFVDTRPEMNAVKRGL